MDGALFYRRLDRASEWTRCSRAGSRKRRIYFGLGCGGAGLDAARDGVLTVTFGEAGWTKKKSAELTLS